MPEKFTFTVKRLRDLPTPEKGRAYVYDARMPGLCLCVSAAGSKILYFYKWAAGRPLRIRLGKLGELSIDAARKAAAGFTAELARGKDLAEERRARRQSPTFQDLFDHWIAHAKERKKTWPEDERMYKKFIKGAWATRRLSSIKQRDVQAMHSQVGNSSGKYQANRVLGMVKAMFNRAWEIGWKGENPADRITKFREEDRDRFLQPEELRTFFQALAEEPNQTARDCILMLLWTGARRGDVQAMRWDAVNLDLGYWRIPSTKSGEPVVVPLVEPALRILNNRLAASDDSPWVFPAHSKSGHIMEPKSVWKRVLERAGLRDLRLHDLRRTLGSWQALGGASLPVIAKSLGHKQVRTTEVYARLQLDPVRASMERATQAMYEAGDVLKLESKG